MLRDVDGNPYAYGRVMLGWRGSPFAMPISDHGRRSLA